MTTDQAGRVAIVTGAGNGLGAAFAKALAESGQTVIVNNRVHADRPSSARMVAQEIVAAGGLAVADGTAVDALGAAAAIVSAAADRFGRLDTLVLNAGISGPACKVGDGDMALADIMQINFFANVDLVEAALPVLRDSPSGRIVFVSSTGGLHGVRGRAAYAASKGAINGWALSLADELRRTEIRVNILAPYASTAMTAQPGREADPRLAPAQAAAALVWLCDPATQRTGEIWVAAAGHVRPARAMEGDLVPVGDLQALGQQDLPMTRSKGFGGGEAAFADFYAEVQREGGLGA